MGRMGKYRDVKEISEIFGFPSKTIQNMCHARCQKFAVRLVPNGKFWIDPEKFQAYIDRNGVKG